MSETQQAPSPAPPPPPAKRDRSTYIGGSDAMAALGLCPYKSELRLYLEKRKEVEPEPPNLRMLLGTAAESVILDRFEALEGVRVLRDIPQVFLKDRPFIGGTLDGIALREKRPAMHRAVVDAKKSTYAKDYGAEFTDQVPQRVAVQITIYQGLGLRAGVIESEKGYVALAVDGEEDIRRYVVNYDDALFLTVCDRLESFWDRVLKGNPPAPRSEADVRMLFPRSAPGKEIVATEQVMGLFHEFEAMKEKAANYKDAADTLAEKLKVYMADAEILLDPGRKKIATWKTDKPGQTFDSKRCQSENLDLVKKYLVDKEPVRRFLVEKSK